MKEKYILFVNRMLIFNRICYFFSSVAILSLQGAYWKWYWQASECFQQDELQFLSSTFKFESYLWLSTPSASKFKLILRLLFMQVNDHTFVRISLLTLHLNIIWCRYEWYTDTRVGATETGDWSLFLSLIPHQCHMRKDSSGN